MKDKDYIIKKVYHILDYFQLLLFIITLVVLGIHYL